MNKLHFSSRRKCVRIKYQAVESSLLREAAWSLGFESILPAPDPPDDVNTEV